MNELKSMLILGVLSVGFLLHTANAANLAKVDTSTPKGTVKGVFDLSVAGDFDGMRKLFVTPANDKEKELLAEGFSDDLYVPALSAALLEKFPDAQVPQRGQMIERAKAEIDKLTEKIDGESATLSHAVPPTGGLQYSGPFQQPMVFKKVGGAWKIAITENVFLRMPPPPMRSLARARCQAMASFIEEVKAGKYATYEKFNRVMNLTLTAITEENTPHPPVKFTKSSNTPNNNASSSADDKSALALIADADALIEQKKAPEAEAKLLEVFPLKSKLSPKVREQVPFTILSLIMLDPERGKKLRPQWDKL
jgi:hypothetical protein